MVVSGTPGTGKTTLAKSLAKKLKYSYIDVNEIIKENKLEEGFDKKRKSKIIDTKKLKYVYLMTDRAGAAKNSGNAKDYLNKVEEYETETGIY